MEDEELARLRQKRLQEYQYKAQIDEQQQVLAEEQYAREEAMRQTILRQILMPDARERLGRLRTARPDFANQVEHQLIMLAQSGRLQKKIDDKTLKQILVRIMPKKKEIKIERR